MKKTFHRDHHLLPSLKSDIFNLINYVPKALEILPLKTETKQKCLL